MNTILTVLIPVRTTENYDIVERLNFKRKDPSANNAVEFIVIDDGSNSEGAKALKEEADRLGYKYLRIDSEDKFFSLARARNYGAQHANGKYLLIEDVDFAPYQGFYSDIIEEIALWELDQKQEDFFSIPAIWLTKEMSEEYLACNTKAVAKKIIQKYLEFDTRYFEFGVPCGSTLVVSKHHYLSIGGQNERFERWGFEDHEFANRLLRFSVKFPNPVNSTKYLPTQFDEYVNYEGFRSRYRLHGDLVASKGIYTFHINHPISTQFRSPQIREANRLIFEECRAKMDQDPYYLGSLDNLASSERTLLSSNNPFIFNNEIWPLLGRVYFYDDGVHSVEEYLDFIAKNKITRVLMQNPYKNEKQLEIYKALRKEGIRCIVAERGALPESIYFDETGFCCESANYTPDKWDRELTTEERENVLEYIKNFKSSGRALEAQAAPIGGEALKKKLNIKHLKILFVPFQTRTDATVRYFAGKIGTYDNFLNLVREVANKLPKDWVLCYKNHPIEPEKHEISNAICLDNYHINDILEASSGVLLMNSGCGILSMLYGVPVLHCAQAQYDNEKLNRYISSTQEVLDFCAAPFTIKEEDCLKFIHYLVFEFYSFAENICIKRPGKPDSWPVKVRFRKIRFPEEEAVMYFRDASKAVWRKSVLFDRYRKYLNTEFDKAKKKPTSQPTNAVQSKSQERGKAVVAVQSKSKEQGKIVVETPKTPNAGLAKKRPLEKMFFNAILSKKLAQKYNKDREAYFRDSKSILARAYYSLFN